MCVSSNSHSQRGIRIKWRERDTTELLPMDFFIIVVILPTFEAILNSCENINFTGEFLGKNTNLTQEEFLGRQQYIINIIQLAEGFVFFFFFFF